jgi:hypothetical protein
VIGVLVVIVLVACGALAVYGLAGAVLNRPPGREVRPAVGAVVALLALQAVIAAVRMIGGVPLPEASTFLIYLVVSVCVIPIAAQFALAERTRWSGAVIAAGAIGTAVAVVRLQGLWNAGV